MSLSSDSARGVPPVRGRKPNPGLRESRRNEIIKSAYAVLTERGYERTLMSDIARHAGVGNGTVYRYFDSKRELADHVFDYAVAKATDALDFESLIDGDVVAGGIAALIDAIGTRLFALIDEDPAIIRVLTVESSAIDAELRWRVNGVFALLDTGLAQLFERFSDRPDVRRDLWPLLGRLIVGTGNPGLLMSLQGRNSATDRAELLSTMKAVASRGLLDFGVASNSGETRA